MATIKSGPYRSAVVFNETGPKNNVNQRQYLAPLVQAADRRTNNIQITAGR